jgi:universal stress protein E
MEKFTRILAVVERACDGVILLEKAVAVARSFGARVELLICEVAHAHALAKLCSQREYDEVTLATAHCGGTPMHEVILRRVLESPPDLVIKSPAGTHPLRRFSLEDNDWQLAQECPVPLLLVRNRPWSKPARFAAAVDVSDRDTEEVTRAILSTAGYLAMGLHGSLDILYSEREQNDEAVRIGRAVKLAQLVREFHVGCERIQVFSGDPAKVLPPLATSRNYDVVVLGARTRQHGIQSMLGGVTGRMIEATEGDVVLVKAPLPAGAGIFERGDSSSKQRFHEFEQLV